MAAPAWLARRGPRRAAGCARTSRPARASGTSADASRPTSTAAPGSRPRSTGPEPATSPRAERARARVPRRGPHRSRARPRAAAATQPAPRASLAGVVALLALAVAAGVVALVQRREARSQATVALARQLGAEALSEPRIDRAMLLARQAVELNDSPETEGTLLATLLRSPAVTGRSSTHSARGRSG